MRRVQAVHEIRRRSVSRRASIKAREVAIAILKSVHPTVKRLRPGLFIVEIINMKSGWARPRQRAPVPRAVRGNNVDVLHNFSRTNQKFFAFLLNLFLQIFYSLKLIVSEPAALSHLHVLDYLVFHSTGGCTLGKTHKPLVAKFLR